MAHTVTLITHPNRLGVAEPLGYRFAVHVTPTEDPPLPIDPADLSSCVNAGWRPTLDECNVDGQTQASTAVGADGCYPVPTGPGLGVALDWDFIERRRTGYHRFGA